VNELPPPTTTPGTTRSRFARRALLGGAAAMAGVTVLAPDALAASIAPTDGTAARTDRPGGPGSVSGAPRLSASFRRTFTSHFIHANGLRQHAVIGGEGPPLLLVHGWPETWYAWRLLMPALARDFTVIAVDQRGIGLTGKPRDGYDSATLADDLAGLMDALGHGRFALLGHDTGYFISYALAADHRDRVERVALAEVPGPPTLELSPPMFVAEALNNRLWHIPFNRVDDELIVDMVRGSAAGFYGYEFRIQSGGVPLPEYAIRYYVHMYNRSRDALRATFGLYRAWDASLEQNKQRQASPLTIPVLGIGGQKSWGTRAADGMRPFAKDVQGVVIPGAGHWVAEQAPAEMLAALGTFFAPYRAAVAS
jgi:pimeloyl-ACP methyl ester carboxylesterase